ncbi:molybdate ABC transporter substrate-binding protein [Nocardioides solisilvae]|uniref:molybdate ABC transporter substrate-binding protein n=1 Tax=Nocardioides solisilvae TaxID=1542435 RepID=UPI000D7468F3|nr:molybdate ABC transporter substrate-binding protein [Nocardioides solisilvae]
MRAPLVAAVVLVAAGCGAAGDGGTGGDGTELTVFAAASLAGPFEQVAETFEAEHEGVRVRLSLAGSSDLVAQVEAGAPADVLATADEETMQRLVDADLADGDPVPFAANRLQLAVPPGNPAGVRSLADLARPGLALVLCAPEVPCGAASARLAGAAGVTLSPVSEERSVTDVLAKVTSGEADAGLVYATDVLAAGDAVEGIALADEGVAPNVYPVVPVAGADEPGLAADFVALLTGPTGQRALADAGFLPARGGR